MTCHLGLHLNSKFPVVHVTFLIRNDVSFLKPNIAEILNISHVRHSEAILIIPVSDDPIFVRIEKRGIEGVGESP